MRRNLTIEELTKVHELGEKAMKVATMVKEKVGFEFIYDFSYGIHNASVFINLKCEEVDVIKVVSFNIMNDDEYSTAEKALDNAMDKIENDCKEEKIAFYEKKLAELRG